MNALKNSLISLSVVASVLLFAGTASAATPTTLTVSSVSGTYGGTVNLTATLTQSVGGAPISGKTIIFTLNNIFVGIATTNALGVASDNNVPTLTTSAGTHTNFVKALYFGGGGFVGDNGSANLTLAQKTLTITGITASDKPYDTTTSATINTTNAHRSGVVLLDTVTIDTTGASGVFTDANAGVGKTVNISGITLGGSSAANYTLGTPQATATATITPIAQTFSFGTLTDQIYGAADFSVSATSNSTGVTVFSGFGSCSVNASTVHLFAVGPCTIVATNPGDVNYTAAGPLTQSFNVTPSTQVVYNALPATFLGNAASLGYQATQTVQFGDYIHLGGTNRLLNDVTVTMSDWALKSTPANVTFCAANTANCTADGKGYMWPITINVYSNHLGANGAPDTLLATKAVNTFIPWRPEADATCATPTAWRNPANGTCYNGLAFNATFDLSSLNVILPNDVIVGVAYNTQSYGTAPVGVDGPYNSLNVAIPDNQPVTVGSDDNATEVFWNTGHASFYTDGGTAGVGIFRKDTSWTNGPASEGTVALQLTASPVTTTSNSVLVTASTLATTITDALTNVSKWYLYNDSNDTVDSTLGSFVTGPTAAPLGVGSVQFTLGANPLDRKDVATFAYQGTSLKSIKNLSFASYSHSGVAGATESPYLVFNVDFNGSGTWQKRLVYVPSENGPAPQDVWNTNDAIKSGAALWNYSGTTWPVTAVGPDAGLTGVAATTLRTWSAIVADYPNARILPLGGLLGVRVGEPGPTAYTANVDAFAIGIQTGSNINTTTYDFEPSFGNLVINSYACPLGTSVTRIANGVGQSIPTGCVAKAGTIFGYVHGTQTDANSPYPELAVSPFTLAGTSDGSGVVTKNLAASGRYLVAETDSSGNQLPAASILGLYCIGDGDTSGTNDNRELTFVPANDSVHCVSYDTFPLPAPTPVSPANNTVVASADQSLIDWTDVGDAYTPTVYFYQVSNDPATSTDGSFVTPVFSSSALSVSQIATPNTPDGVYYWHVYAQDNNGNKSPWSITQKITVQEPAPTPTVEVHIFKYLDGAQATDESANNVNFPMFATYNTIPFGSGTNAPFTLGPAGWTDGDTAYEASTGAYNMDASYSTSENTSTSLVGTSCDSGATYQLVGYSTGTTKDEAVANGSVGENRPSAIAPNFPDLTQDEYVIVWNTTCPPVVPPTPTPSVTTNDATVVTNSDATLNGTNGTVAAQGHSFWVSLSPSIDTSSATIPSGVYSTPDLGAIGASASFNAQLSSVTGLPTIQPSTTYYYVAWINVGGTWIPSTVQKSFMTNEGAPVVPSTPSVTTNAASNISIADAKLNGTNNAVAADGSSFWVSTSTIDTSSPTIPTGVYSTIDLGSVVANTSFNAQLSAATGIPAITPSTTYNYVAWVRVGSTWYPASAPQSFTTSAVVLPLVANPLTATSTNDAAIALTLTGTGGAGPLTYIQDSAPLHGAISGTLPHLTYTPSSPYFGSDSFTFKITDGINTSDDAVVTINTVDTIPPTITLAGSNPASITVGTTYIDPGITVTDNSTTGNLGYSWSVDGGATSTDGTPIAVDTTSAGTHTIFISAHDSAGNTSTASRTVNVTAPVAPETPTPPAPAPSGGGGNGPISQSFGVSFGGGSVLGASTSTVPQNTVTPTTPISCSALLTSYMAYGKKNDSAQVTRLQRFLKDHGYTINVNGFFDLTTRAAVKVFQTDHKADVLNPWGLLQPTGIVFKTTLYEINKVNCPTLNAPVPQV